MAEAQRVALAAGALRLCVHQQRQRMQVGAALARGPGASLEFHDHRAYLAGDDLRYLDWGILARSDQLVIRRHHQEIRPQLTICLDASASMGIDQEKWHLARDLAALFAQLAEAAAYRPQLYISKDRWQLLPADCWRRRLEAVEPAGAGGLQAVPPRFLAGGERIIISDGLCPQGVQSVVAALAQGAVSLTLLEILSPAELHPQACGPVELQDVEGGSQEVLFDQHAATAYQQRLGQHRQAWQRALAGRGPGLISCPSEAGWQAALQTLLGRGLVEQRRA